MLPNVADRAKRERRSSHGAHAPFRGGRQGISLLVCDESNTRRLCADSS
jgi:hypothetical protein